MFEQSIEDLQSGHSLGSSAVVSKLAGQFIHDVATAPTVTALFMTVNRFADIFLGLDSAYQPVADWNDGQHLGQLLVRRLSIAQNQASADIFRTAFGIWARQVMTTIKAHAKDGGGEAEVDTLKRFMVACLLGTVDTLYPN